MLHTASWKSQAKDENCQDINLGNKCVFAQKKILTLEETIQQLGLPLKTELITCFGTLLYNFFQIVLW